MESEFVRLFGEGLRGRPKNEDGPVGISTGDPKITELARRRATRVLRAENKDRFEQLMRQEAEYLLCGAEYPVGVKDAHA